MKVKIVLPVELEYFPIIRTAIKITGMVGIGIVAIVTVKIGQGESELLLPKVIEQ